MVDFDVQRCTRRCHRTGRELLPGESVYSVLVRNGERVERQDFAAEAWTVPPEEALGWWKSKLPESSARKSTLAPNDVLLAYFEQQLGVPGAEELTYVMALLMIRRRILRLDETVAAEGGGETLVLFCQRNEREYRVPVAMPSDERARAIQEQLAPLLFSEASPADAEAATAVAS